MKIISFTEKYAPDFKRLNVEWIEKYFKMEELDEQLLSNPKQEIIRKGGEVFFAKLNDKIVGTAALIKIEEGSFELAKMAVSKKNQGKGIGNELLKHIISFTQEKEIQKLILYTHKSLKTAIHLYEKHGFKEVVLESGGYERVSLKMEKIV